MTRRNGRRRGGIARVLRRARRALLIPLLFPVVWVAAYRVVDPPTNYYMIGERMRLSGIEREWRDLGDMSPHLPLAAIAAEDSRFCAHWGIDVAAVRRAIREGDGGRRLRGGSTITQQVAKNVFLWPERSWVRKGLEAGFAVLIEALWPKRRIVEVYLNIAEFDEGVFGVEAAARRHFGKPSADLRRIEAARLAAVLPDPKGRSASRPGGWTRRRAAAIADGAATLERGGGADCVQSAAGA